MSTDLTPEELERIERSLGGECAICDATTRRLIAEVRRLREAVEFWRGEEARYRDLWQATRSSLAEAEQCGRSEAYALLERDLLAAGAIAMSACLDGKWCVINESGDNECTEPTLLEAVDKLRVERETGGGDGDG